MEEEEEEEENTVRVNPSRLALAALEAVDGADLECGEVGLKRRRRRGRGRAGA